MHRSSTNTRFVNKFKKNKNFVIKDEKLLEKYESIWNKMINIIRKEFDKELVNDGEYLNTKLKCCSRKIKTDFHGEKATQRKISLLLFVRNCT